jgi:hypothetical protein
MTDGAPMTMTVIEKDYSIELPQKSLALGTQTFRVKNQGLSPHDLRVMGSGLSSAGSRVINRGATTEFTVTLQPGTYQLWCSVDGHRVNLISPSFRVGRQPPAERRRWS